MTTTQNNAILDALLNADDTVETNVHMARFGVDFRVKAVTFAQIKRLRLQATHVVGKKEVLDEELFAALLIVEATVNVDWKNPQLLAKYDTTDASDVVKARLLPGEVTYLSAEIMSVSGFDQDERINAAKN